VGLSYYATRTAVITGAGSGIGRALATGLARRGAHLALSDRDAGAVAETAQQCRLAGSRVRADTVDVTDRQAVLGYPAAVLGDFAHVDLVFCVAGVIHTGSLMASGFPDIDHVINVNLFGVINTAKAFLPHLISSGSGHIVTVSSGFGLMAAPHYSAYNASKFAVRGFSEALRQEMMLDGHPVSVTCVYPGRIRTAIMRNGSFAAGENPAAITAGFDKIARMDADQAAAVILRGVARRRRQLLVGADARAVSLLVRAAGSGYQDLLPLARRIRKIRRSARTRPL
jgi:short-subunit dehydrogenase